MKVQVYKVNGGYAIKDPPQFQKLSNGKKFWVQNSGDIDSDLTHLKSRLITTFKLQEPIEIVVID